MGIYAVKSAALELARHNIGNPAARLLFYMADECWDEKRGDAEPRRYYVGRASLAIAPGYLAPRNDSDAARTAVKRCVRELVEASSDESESDVTGCLQSTSSCSSRVVWVRRVRSSGIRFPF